MHPLKLRHSRLVMTLAWVCLLAYFFANVEIQIEGSAGWGAALPTWRIEQHWLLDLFAGGKSLTGYHAWVFPFIVLSFHFPLVYAGKWCWRAECQIVACVMLFWIVEDFLWFMLNPAFGIERFNAASIPWHKYWLWGAPVEYWAYSGMLLFLLWLSSTAKKDT